MEWLIRETESACDPMLVDAARIPRGNAASDLAAPLIRLGLAASHDPKATVTLQMANGSSAPKSGR